jgi:hypothetical protein
MLFGRNVPYITVLKSFAFVERNSKMVTTEGQCLYMGPYEKNLKKSNASHLLRN